MRVGSLPTVFISALVAAVFTPHPARAENWPGWRGPQRTGNTTETGIPLEWSASEGIAWRVDLPGSGISNPIVWDDRVIVTASDGLRQEELHVICLARDDGRELWRQRLWGTRPTLYHATKSSMATPSPVTDGQHVFAFFGTGDVFCIDMDGGLVWQRSLADEYGAFENRFAASSSPLVHDDLLIVQCDHYGASYVLALDKATGTNRWKADRPDCWLSWSSPQIIPAAADRPAELVVCGSEKIDSFNPASGEHLWTVRGMARECVPTPVLAEGLLLAVSGPGGKSIAIRPGGRGDVTESHVEWTSPRGAPFVPSGILVGGRYFLVDDKGIATCLRAATGDVVWRKRLAGAFTASPVAAEGRVYCTNEDGLTVVIAADTDDYQELARNPLGEPVYASAAISQGRIYLRSASGLFAIGGKQ